MLQCWDLRSTPVPSIDWSVWRLCREHVAWGFWGTNMETCQVVRLWPFCLQVVQDCGVNKTFMYPIGSICYICWPWRKLDKSKFQKSESTIRYKDGAGRDRFKGSPKLKATQVYTRSFGTAEPRLHFMCYINNYMFYIVLRPKLTQSNQGARTWGVQEVHHLCQCLAATSPRNWLWGSMDRCQVSWLICLWSMPF